jgi:hypothetical protein
LMLTVPFALSLFLSGKKGLTLEARLL